MELGPVSQRLVDEAKSRPVSDSVLLKRLSDETNERLGFSSEIKESDASRLIDDVIDNPIDALKGVSTAPFTAAPDILGLGIQGMNAAANFGRRTFGLPEGETFPGADISGDTIRELVGLDPDSAAGILGEFADPTTGIAKGGAKLAGLLAERGPELLAGAKGALLFHETDRANVAGLLDTGFDIGRVSARSSESHLPDGVFLKDTDNQINVARDPVQLRANATLRNTAQFENRDDLLRFLDADDEYRGLRIEADRIDGQIAKEFDEVWNRGAFEDHSDEAEVAFQKELDDILEVGRQRLDDASKIARQRAQQVLKDAGYDSVRIANDAGSMNRSTDTTVVFDPSAVSFEKFGLLSKASPTLSRFTPAGELSDSHRAIETRFAQQLSDDLDGSIARYNEIPDTKGGVIVSTDEARKLDPSFAQDGSLSAAVHEPASAFAKELWVRKLAEPVDTGEVLLMSGGTGAGKSSGLKKIGEQYDAIFDSNLANYEKAQVKIQEALESGRNVDIMHVWRDPVVAFSGEGGSAISRANRMGRTVPLSAHVDTHVGSNQVVKRLSQEYADDPRVNIRVIDNSGGKDDIRALPIGDTSVIEDINPQELMRKISAELETARQTGGITERTYQGFKGQP